MTIELTKLQRQEMGTALLQAGSTPGKFVFTAKNEGDTETVVLTHRESSDSFMISQAGSVFTVRKSIPGRDKYDEQRTAGWQSVLNLISAWAGDVDREHEAVDPWAGDAEEMLNDDSYFTLTELPQVDIAIDASLEDLKKVAASSGKKIDNMAEQIAEISAQLKKTARNSTKKEWISIFRGIIVGKLLDWGLSTDLFQSVLHTLISSVHDVAQLAAHASTFLIQ